MQLENITYVNPSSLNSTKSPNGQLGKDEFLQLLVTKLSYQDPLDPVSDEDFVAQLAQFSSLEQLENMNKNLEDSLDWNYYLSQTLNNTTATNLIGRVVRSDSSQVYLDSGADARIALTLGSAASDITVTITDADGNVVRTLTHDHAAAGDLFLEWDGLSDNGTTLPEGVYKVSAKATNVDGNSFRPGLFTEGTVDGVRYVQGAAFLEVNGQQIPLSAVHEIREG